MKHLLTIVVCGCLAFVVLLWAARFVSVPGSFTGGGDYSGGYSSDYSAETNPLLDFGDSGSYGDYDSYTGGPNTRPTDGAGTSPYAGKVILSLGSASYAIQTYEEYVTLQSTSGSVNITGWVLTNSKGTRPIENRQNNYVYPAADSAVIGLGTEFLNPSGSFQTGSIILKKGDIAYLTTGKPFSQFPFKITTSFRENICMGYLENYPFTPQISRSCPVIARDPAIQTVTDNCYDYINSMYSCTDPEKTDKKRYELLTTQCRAFISARVGYSNCVNRNAETAKFSTNQWRVFLGKDREMWASQRETVTLYDAQGLIVDQISY